MSVFLALIVGSIVGWSAVKVLGYQAGLLSSIILGITGSITGSFLSVLMSDRHQAYLSFSWHNLFWSCIGALLFVALLNAVQGSPHHSNY